MILEFFLILPKQWYRIKKNFNTYSVSKEWICFDAKNLKGFESGDRGGHAAIGFVHLTYLFGYITKKSDKVYMII